MRKDDQMPDEIKGTNDPRVYFAAERTFLAWIRTGLGLMGVGFAVSRFGLFLREMHGAEMQGPGAHSPIRTTGLSVFSGVALVALGVLVNVTAVLQHIRTTRELRDGTWIAGRVSGVAVILSLILATVGVGMVVYLLYLR
jgi:putative membrane protein